MCYSSFHIRQTVSIVAKAKSKLLMPNGVIESFEYNVETRSKIEADNSVYILHAAIDTYVSTRRMHLKAYSDIRS